MLRRVEQVLALLGGVSGVAVVAWASTVVESASRTGLIVVVAIALSPYIVAVSTVLPWGAEAWRGTRLAVSTWLSMALAFATGFSIGATFIPSTVLLALATVAAGASRPRGHLGLLLAGGSVLTLAAAAYAALIPVLLSGSRDAEPSGWAALAGAAGVVALVAFVFVRARNKSLAI